jgi:hypothetical protein
VATRSLGWMIHLSLRILVPNRRRLDLDLEMNARSGDKHLAWFVSIIC